MIILGINAYHPNASAAIVVDGKLIAAVEEERFNRVKYAAGLPVEAVRFCLAQAGVTLGEVDHVVIPRDPWARVGTKLRFALRMPRFALNRTKVMARSAGIKEDLADGLGVSRGTFRAQVHRIEHHRAHLASTFHVSPFDTAMVLSADGLGDFASAMWATGEGTNVHQLGSVVFPHSLGIYYTALSQYLGFLRFGDEFKVMGLAAYGEHVYLDAFRKIVHTHPTNFFRLNLDYFIHQREGADMTWRDAGKTPEISPMFSAELEKLLGPARKANAPVEKRHRDIAASLQARLEEVLLAHIAALGRSAGQKNLCLAGGVAFNCVANGKIFDASSFERVYVQPAAGDAGLAVGAAYAVYHEVLGNPRTFTMEHAGWGPGFAPQDVGRLIATRNISNGDLKIDELPEEVMLQATAKHIAAGKVIGWFQGRAEWGPRALGNRSILADPRRADMKDILNQRIKHRETFRPFAPSVIEEATGEFFERTDPSPFMTFAYPVRPEKRLVIPAPTHVDGTARLQTVSHQHHPLYWRLIREFGNQTGVPVLLNTSFNENEPIVCRLEEALDCFLRTKMDVLVLGNHILEKKSPAAGA
ncbi:MAG: carbamoyltransferase C-terminal domain-containing protein [Candidatus Acidiferrales bacterium]